MGKVIGVYREKVFSPGKIVEDSAILDTTLRELSMAGQATRKLDVAELSSLHEPPKLVLTMAQSSAALDLLADWNRNGTRVINSTSSVLNCYRTRMLPLLVEAGIPLPASEIVPIQSVAGKLSFRSGSAYWLKRGDVHAIRRSDVVKVNSEPEIDKAVESFGRNGIPEVLVQEHREGEVVKFYGVGKGHFFMAYRAGKECEMTSGIKRLVGIAADSAEVLGLEVYGGDAVLTPGDGITLIDINDWPSFSFCCRAAARKIADYVRQFL